MTVIEAIKEILKDYPNGLSCQEITARILEKGLYTFNTPNPNNIVNHELRRHCANLDFPTAHPMKHFALIQDGTRSNKARYCLLSQKPMESSKLEHETESTNESGTSELLPAEKIIKLHKQHIKEMQRQLLEAILNNPPAFFEELVVNLLLKLGYGYNQNAGAVIGKSHDGGIDGIINEDALGLDKIYIQAKRYATSQSIGRPELQAFAGAMMAGGVKKGVFITTSTFTKAAKEFIAKQTEKNISLVDGQMLTQLMIQNEVGVRTVHSFGIFEIDSNFFNID